MVNARMRRTALGLLVGFGIQFAVGMLLNLFVELPKTHPGSTGDEYFTRSFTSLGWALSGAGGPALFTHALIGTLLFLSALVFFIQSLALRAEGWRWVAGLTALFTFGAFFNGMSFVDYGEDFSSAIMAGCWLGAVTCLVVGLVRRRSAPVLPSGAPES